MNAEVRHMFVNQIQIVGIPLEATHVRVLLDFNGMENHVKVQWSRTLVSKYCV